MRSRQEVVERIRDLGVVAIVRADTGDEALAAARAVRAGGLNAIEVTFTVPGAAEIIHRLSQEMGEDLLLGAGTVLTPA
ncbi:MAG TPA: 2-dehydro-3-deoxyphosphogluconate aldolase, partial [Armatimonadota bacterium]|nr:2-dehydro-3-deoxyphosphogluconate aldolase [Armatimonadota bacterium]